MRRIVSIAMLLLLGLGPLSALVPGSDESQLPACCRRHGVHHCAMSQDQASGSAHLFSAPASCPQYHRAAPATRGVFTLPAAASAGISLTAEPVIAAVRTVTLYHARTADDRGPPALL